MLKRENPDKWNIMLSSAQNSYLDQLCTRENKNLYDVFIDAIINEYPAFSDLEPEKNKLVVYPYRKLPADKDNDPVYPFSLLLSDRQYRFLEDNLSEYISYCVNRNLMKMYPDYPKVLIQIREVETEKKVIRAEDVKDKSVAGISRLLYHNFLLQMYRDGYLTKTQAAKMEHHSGFDEAWFLLDKELITEVMPFRAAVNYIACDTYHFLKETKFKSSETLEILRGDIAGYYNHTIQDVLDRFPDIADRFSGMDWKMTPEKLEQNYRQWKEAVQFS